MEIKTYMLPQLVKKPTERKYKRLRAYANHAELLRGRKKNKMEQIASFKIDHTQLLPGLYISRKDKNGSCTLTTFDLRLTAPNREPVIDMPALHTIEHMGATYLRNSSAKDKIVYFGPMGCRTGFYLIMFGNYSAEDAFDLVLDMCSFILSYAGDIPGARPEQCGNYAEQNLSMAKYYIQRYKNALEDCRRFYYP